jgi:hypothetical protein
MAEVTIRLIYNLETGKKDIYIDYESDADALPLEHEQQHRQIVEKLLGKGILKPAEVGDVKVGRVAPEKTPPQQEQLPPQREKQAEGR